jgi:hypothetical protein
MLFLQACASLLLVSALDSNDNPFKHEKKKTMRFIKFITKSTLLAVAVIAAASCTKVLDQQPYSAFTDESVFTTQARADLALNGVYDAAQTGGPSLAGRGYPFGAATIEQGDNRGEDMVNLQAFYQITYQGTYTPATANNVSMWDNTYSMINKANIAIEGFRKAAASGVLTGAVATQYEAECRFLRALGHHELLIHFARPFLDGAGSALGVPYRDYAVTGSVTLEKLQKEPRPTVAAGYSKLLEDLAFAETNLPVTNSAGPIYRAQKSAAIALKQRVLMHMGRWADAITAGNALIPAALNTASPASVRSLVGNHALMATPAGSFGSPGGNSVTAENIFTVKNDPLDNGSVNGAPAAMYGSTDLLGRGLVCVSPIIWNNTGWLEDDLRRTSLYRNGGTAIGRAIMTTKYTDHSGRGDNTPIIRWAEVLLNQAESEARASASVSARAVDLLNMVRNRSLANLATQQYTVASFATPTALLQAILLERRIEFLAEGRRWPDIHRTVQDPVAAVRPVGIPAKVTNGGVTGTTLAQYGFGKAVVTAQAAIPYSDFRFIWPVPQTEITSNPIIVQNPGY